MEKYVNLKKEKTLMLLRIMGTFTNTQNKDQPCSLYPTDQNRLESHKTEPGSYLMGRY